jgi:hypothetical protein
VEEVDDRVALAARPVVRRQVNRKAQTAVDGGPVQRPLDRDVRRARSGGAGRSERDRRDDRETHEPPTHTFKVVGFSIP